jgi:hypothetical protein
VIRSVTSRMEANLMVLSHKKTEGRFPDPPTLL